MGKVAPVLLALFKVPLASTITHALPVAPGVVEAVKPVKLERVVMLETEIPPPPVTVALPQPRPVAIRLFQ